MSPPPSLRNNKLINQLLEQTYVFKDGKVKWLVSTLNRESSAALAYGMIYAETFVWELGTSYGEVTKRLVAQDEAGQDSLYAHDKMVRRLRETGNPEEPGDDND